MNFLVSSLCALDIIFNINLPSQHRDGYVRGDQLVGARLRHPLLLAHSWGNHIDCYNINDNFSNLINIRVDLYDDDNDDIIGGKMWVIVWYQYFRYQVGMWAAQKKSDVEGISEEVERISQRWTSPPSSPSPPPPTSSPPPPSSSPPPLSPPPSSPPSSSSPPWTGGNYARRPEYRDVCWHLHDDCNLGGGRIYKWWDPYCCVAVFFLVVNSFGERAAEELKEAWDCPSNT